MMKKVLIGLLFFTCLLYGGVKANAGSWIFIPGSSSSSLLTGIVSYWNFNETSGTRADQLGANDLTSLSGDGFTAGVVSNAVTLGNHAFVCAPNNASQSPTGSFTFAGWAKFTAITGTQPWILENVASNGSSRGYYFTIRSSVFEMQLSSDGVTPVFAQATTFGTPSTGTWYFLQTGFDQANSQGFISVNGGTIDTVSFAGPQHSSAQQFCFGVTGGGGSDPEILDEWGLWGRVLTSAEIITLYNSGAGTTYPGFALNEVIPFLPRAKYAAKRTQSPFVLARYAR